MTLDAPVDVAARVSYGFSIEDVGEGVFEISAVFSREAEQVHGLTMYGSLGLATGLGDSIIEDTELTLTAGVTYDVPVENMELFSEFKVVDDLFIGIGAKFGF